jgi:hypothetical protein
MRRYWIIFAFILLFATTAKPVQACSGGGSGWTEWLTETIADNSIIVVRGQYAELDDVGKNGIFQVQSYLKGGGAEYLTLSATELGWIENDVSAGRYYGCWMGWFSYRIGMDGKYVYFLRRQENGIYRIVNQSYFGSSEDTRTFYESSENYYDLDIEGLSAQITEAVGQDAQSPTTDLPYPRTSPILIKTVSERHYLMPVDSPELVPVAEDSLVELQRNQYACYVPCTAFSPNGLDKVYLRETEADFVETNFLQPTVEHNTIGQRIAFSSTSEAFALWNNNQIELYMLWYPKLNYPDYPFEEGFRPEIINTIPSETSLNYPAVWSPDGRILAFSDDEGLWLWDVFSVDYPPQLLIPASDTVPTARYFSPQGRYLAITEGDRHYNLDLVTGRELPDGYVSPNDRILLVFDTAATEPTALQIQYLAPETPAYDYYAEVQYSHVQWVTNDTFLASVTGFGYLEYEYTEDEAFPFLVEEAFHDVTTYRASGFTGFSSIDGNVVPYFLGTPHVPQMRDFYYQEGQGLIKISVDGYTLSVNGNNGFVNLTPYLTEPIVEATWLPSAFYYER